jgi:hypothetical protein
MRPQSDKLVALSAERRRLVTLSEAKGPIPACQRIRLRRQGLERAEHLALEQVQPEEQQDRRTAGPEEQQRHREGAEVRAGHERRDDAHQHNGRARQHDELGHQLRSEGAARMGHDRSRYVTACMRSPQVPPRAPEQPRHR